MLRALFLLPCLLLPAAAFADSVCIAEDGTPMYVPGSQESVGTLNARRCYAVMDRGEDRTRIWVKDAATFQGEVDVANRDLAYELLDDVTMRLEPSDDPHGEIRSGALVKLESSAADDRFVAVALEGRVQARFIVDADDVFTAESWTEPDPEDTPDAGWPAPEVSWPLPPGEVALTKRPSGYDVRANVTPPLFDTSDVLLDPALGQLRLELVEVRDFESKVRVIGPHLWVEGWVTSVDWRSEPAPEGWKPAAGVPGLTTLATGARQIGDKDAELGLAPKEDPFGAVPAGAWVTLDEEDGSWQRVSVAWEGGAAKGWIEKKGLQKAKKQGDPPKPVVSRVAVIDVGNVVGEWLDPEGHDVQPELTPEAVQGFATAGLPPLRRGYAEALSARPNLTGELTFRLVVTPEGVIFEQSTPVATLADDAVKGALDAYVEAIAFPETKPRKRRLDNNAVVWIQYLFKPLGQ